MGYLALMNFGDWEIIPAGGFCGWSSKERHKRDGILVSHGE